MHILQQSPFCYDVNGFQNYKKINVLNKFKLYWYEFKNRKKKKNLTSFEPI
jgi:hypothetical protein